MTQVCPPAATTLAGVVVVMQPGASKEDVDAVIARVEASGGEAFVSRGVTRTIVGLVGDVETFSGLNLLGMSGVAEVIRVSAPYKLVSRIHHPQMSTVLVRGVPIGPDTFTLIAGPCAVETPQQTLEAAEMAKAAGATLLRGGAYKPRTSPYAFQGLGEAGRAVVGAVVVGHGGQIDAGVLQQIDRVRPEPVGDALQRHRRIDEADAVAMANDTHYGLSAFVHTKNIGAAIRTAHRIDAGWVQVNHGGGQVLGQSYGGYKASGMGREFSLEGMLESYTQRKHISINLNVPD